MSHHFWQTIASTPWWVAVLFFFFAYNGYMATKPREIHIKNLMIIPCIFVALSLFGMVFYIDITPLNLAVWADSLLLGLGYGWLRFSALQVAAIENQQKLRLPGSWVIMIVIIAMFFVRYHYAFQPLINQNMLRSPKVALAMMALYGLFTGTFFGRAAYALRTVKVGPFIAPLTAAAH